MATWAAANVRYRLASRGHTVYWVDLTRQSIAVPAVRVVIPGLQPLPPNPVTPRLARALDVSNRTATDVVSMIPLL